MIALRLLADGAVVREAVFRSPALRIGRGPECDFVILDPSVSREHARLTCDESGAIWIEDAGGRNGLRVAGRRVERAALSAASPVRCQLGNVELEVVLASAADTLEIEMPARFAGGPLAAVRTAALWAAAVLAVAVSSMAEPAFWSPWQQNRLSRLAQSTVGVAIAVPVLAFVMVGVLRVVRRRARISDALRSIAVAGWGWVAVSVLLRATLYLLPVPAHGLLQGFLTAGASALTTAYLATTARRGPNRRFFLAWVGAMAVVLAAFAGAARLAAQQSGAPQVSHELPMPVAGFAGPATDLDRYLEGLRSDYAGAESAAAEERRYSAAAK